MSQNLQILEWSNFFLLQAKVLDWFHYDLLSLACMHVSANRKILNIRTCELCVCLRIVVLFQYEGQWSWESVNVTFCSRSAIAQTPHCSRTRCHWFCIWNGSHFLKKSSKRHNLILPAYHGQKNNSRLYAKYLYWFLPSKGLHTKIID